MNLQIVYRVSDHYFLKTCPSWIKRDDNEEYEYDANEPIKLVVKDTVRTQWDILSPWIDFRSERGEDNGPKQSSDSSNPKFNFPFSVIRLRVKRKPVYYLVNGVLPICLVITCSFAAFVLPVEDKLAEKLSYIITLLLTLTAFQYAFSKDLPKTSESTMIDSYILTGYFILTFFVLEITIANKLETSDLGKVSFVFDYVTVGIFGAIWGWATLRFLIGYWQWTFGNFTWSDCFKTMLHCQCCRCCACKWHPTLFIRDADWIKMSKYEMTKWSQEMGNEKNNKTKTKKYITVEEKDYLV